MNSDLEKFVHEVIERFGGEIREPQMKMIQEVTDAIGENRPVIIECATGGGKGMAYSIPAILAAKVYNKRILIVTRTKKLQNQLSRDLPRYISATLPNDPHYIKWSVIKGRNHFSCQKRVLKSEMVPITLSKWLTDGGGSKDDAPEHHQGEWAEVAGGDDCIGKKCPFFTECPGTQQRQKAAEASIVIANQTLLAMNIALGIPAIPGTFDIIIIDEAQHFEDSIRDRLSNRLNPAILAKNTFTECADELQKLLPTHDFEFHKGIDADSIFYDTCLRATKIAKELDKKIRQTEEPELSVKRELIQMNKIAMTLWSFTQPDDYTLWLDTEGMHSSPIDVKSLIKESLGNKATIFTSATIPDDFGLDQPIINVGGGYTNAGLYVASDLDGGGIYKFRPEAAQQTLQMIQALGGRTLCLYTSERAMQDHYLWLQQRLDVPVYHQNQSNAIERFREEELSVLAGVDSCWEGIDIPGPSLSLIVIDRLPFPNMKDPIYIAQSERKGWYKASIPSTKTMLRQGAGRLLRSPTDCGVLAILDSRIITKSYSSTLLNSLDVQRIPTLDKTLELLRELAAEYNEKM